MDKEMINIGFTMKELKDTLLELKDKPGFMLDIMADDEKMNIPEFRIRYMNTAGGIQYCLKQVSYRGEGSGYYEPLERLDDFIKMIQKQVKRTYESSVRFKDIASRSPNPGMREYAQNRPDLKLKLILKPNEVRPAIFLNTTKDFQKDAVSVNLR